MNFFGVGPGELLLILVVALIVFGPNKLPEIAAGIGRSYREFKKATSDMTQEFTQAMNEAKQPIDEVRQLPGAVKTTLSTEYVPVGNSRICAQCQSPNPKSNKFCGHCGAELPTDGEQM